MSTTDLQLSTSPTVAVAPGPPSAVGLHAQLLRVAASGKDANDVRVDLRQVIKDVTGASFVAHLTANENGEFLPQKQQPEGELASSLPIQTICSVAKFAMARQSTQVKVISEPEAARIVCSPVMTAGAPDEVIVAWLGSELSNFRSAIYTMELASTYQRLWARGNVAVANQWKLNSLAAIVELVSAIEQQDGLAAATNIATNQVAKHLGCARVAVATMKDGQLVVQSLSRMSSFDRNSETVTAMREALAECVIQHDTCVWPPQEGNRSALLAHKALAHQCHFKALLSCPLRTSDGAPVGAWLFADNSELPQGERFRNFVRAASPRVAGALAIVERSQRSVFTKAKLSLQQLIQGRKGKVALWTATILAMAMLIPIPYRVRCRCVVEPVSRRFAVAPFSGMIDEGFVEPGDVVAAGTLLARMDGRELRWELSAAQAERGQAEKKREVDLTERNVPQVLISQFEVEQLDAQIEILRHRMDHQELKSPVEGIVLSGSLEKGQSTPVEQGDVLYEVGPLDELKIEIEIPATEVAQIQEGQNVKVWVDGHETKPISGKIELLEPRSQLRREQNVFVAKMTIPNPDYMYRPGMYGAARVTGPTRPLGWNLFHKPWEYAVSRLSWW